MTPDGRAGPRRVFDADSAGNPATLGTCGPSVGADRTGPLARATGDASLCWPHCRGGPGEGGPGGGPTGTGSLPPTKPNDDQRAPDLQHLKWLALLLPVAGVVVGEILRGVAIDPFVADVALRHIIAGGVAITAVVVFAGFMFIGIERAQRRVIRQNRALRIANAVSVAVQGERTLDEVILRALNTVADATGAIEAAITVFGIADEEGSLHRVTRPQRGDTLTGSLSTIELPLASGTRLVGQLRLEIPAETSIGAVSDRVLQNISHQLGSAIQMAQLISDLRRRRRESGALYEVALAVTSRYALADILRSIVRHAKELLEVDEAIVCLSDATSSAVRDARLVAIENVAVDGAVCFAPGDDPVSMRHDGSRPGFCPVRTSPKWGATASEPLRSADAALGTLWVARRSTEPVDPAGRALLAGLADLAAIAIVSARLQEAERQGAILTERERIAREMHDSLAQVLAASHLRLRALEEKPAVRELPDVQREIIALGDLTHDAYRDVREAILGLRESSRGDRHLLESLRAYCDKFSRQSGIETTLETTDDEELGLPLAVEIQVIRVIQEALTNVRKHARATKATVLVQPSTDNVMLSVHDNGRGFDPASELVNREDSFGLRGMRERMELVGGTLSVHSAPGRGTRITARVARPVLPHSPADRGTTCRTRVPRESCSLTTSRCSAALSPR